MDIDAGGNETGQAARVQGHAGPLPIPPAQMVDAPTFDFEAYISRYGGHTKLLRLDWIAHRSPTHQQAAFSLLLSELKTGLNTGFFKKLAQELGEEYCGGLDWVEDADARARQAQERLEAQLSQHKASATKEAIRECYLELGDLYCQRGDLANATKSYMRSRDYSSTPRHAAEASLKATQVAMANKNTSLMRHYLSKAEHVREALSVDLQAQIQAGSAMLQLESKNFKQAALAFIQVSPALGDGFRGALVAEDVATYGILTALATFTRQELKSRIIENVAFRNFMDLMPRLRDVAQNVFDAQYGRALNTLQALKGEFLLDIHLHHVAEELVAMIRDRCIVQYFSPYLSVKLESMAQAFMCTLPDMESAVRKLIIDGRISARIDSQRKTLHVREAQDRAETYRKVLGLSETYLSEMQGLLLRLSCQKQDFVVKGRPSMHAALDDAAASSPLEANHQDSDGIMDDL